MLHVFIFENITFYDQQFAHRLNAVCFKKHFLSYIDWEGVGLWRCMIHHPNLKSTRALRTNRDAGKQLYQGSCQTNSLVIVRMHDSLHRPGYQQTEIIPAPFQLHCLGTTKQGSLQNTFRAFSNKNISLEFAAVENKILSQRLMRRSNGFKMVKFSLWLPSDTPELS